jgi:hypothetical protein
VLKFKIAEVKNVQDGEPQVVTYTIDEFVQRISKPRVSPTTFESYHFHKSEQKRLTLAKRELKAQGDNEGANELASQASASKAVQLNAKNGPAFLAYHFKNDITFKVTETRNGPWSQRLTGNAVTHFSLITLDIECGVSADEIHKVLSDFEYIIWSTISSKPGDARFRVILFPSEPLKTKDAQRLISAIDVHLPDRNDVSKKTQCIDAVSLEEARLMYFPKWLSNHPEKYFWKHNKGRLITKDDFLLSEEQQERVSKRLAEGEQKRQKMVLQNTKRLSSGENALLIPNQKKIKNENDWLNPDAEFEAEGGWVRLKDVTGKVVNVTCPFHGDSVGSDFIDLNSKSGRPQFVCHSCGVFKMFPGKDEPLVLKKKESTHEPFEDTSPEKRTFNPPADEKSRRAEINKAVQKALTVEHTVIRTAEGYGKSTGLVQKLLSLNQEILFCCSSNKQANEKVESFKLYGAERVWSTSALIEHELKVKPVMIESGKEWAPPMLDIEETAKLVTEKLKMTLDEATEAVLLLKDEARASRESKAKVLVTTFAMGNVLFQTAMGRTGRVIIVDDPSTGDLLTKKVELQDEGEAPEVVAERSVEETPFGKRFFGQDKIIWTTTEHLVTRIIKHFHQAQVVDIQENLQTNGHVLLKETTLVRKATKIVLPGIHECVKHNTKSSVRLISNSLGLQFNLVNTKGRNDLKGDTVIVISQPHNNEILSLCATLDDFNQHEIKRQMMVDVMDQALGRSQGHRGGEHYALVLCDPAYKITLQNRSRYELQTEQTLKRRTVKFHGVPVEFVSHMPPWWPEWFSYISTWQQWVITVGSTVWSLLDMQKMNLTVDELKRIKKQLHEPVKQHIVDGQELPSYHRALWQIVSETLPEEGTRRNITQQVEELVKMANKEAKSRKKMTSMNKEQNKKRAGKVRYTSPDGTVRKMYVPGTEPTGWITTNRRLNRGKTKVGRPGKTS